jgi:hypothetical protein
MKNRLLKLATLAVASATFAFSALATPIMAPFSRWSLFTDSNNPGWINNYTAVSTANLGTMKFLKYTASTQATLVSSLAMTNTTKYASSKVWNNGSYQQISELGYLGECVGFAKAMTGSSLGTLSWTKLSTNALTTLFPLDGVVPAGASPDFIVPPGTMILNFNGESKYNNLITNHTAIVLNVVVVNGKVTGANVVAQNAADTAGGIGGADRMISKYFLPWNNTTSTKTSMALKNYHVITAP